MEEALCIESFLRFYNGINFKNGLALKIYHSSITDWNITVGYKETHPKKNKEIIVVSGSDIELVFAKAQVELKQWFLENKDGY